MFYSIANKSACHPWLRAVPFSVDRMAQGMRLSTDCSSIGSTVTPAASSRRRSLSAMPRAAPTVKVPSSYNKKGNCNAGKTTGSCHWAVHCHCEYTALHFTGHCITQEGPAKKKKKKRSTQSGEQLCNPWRRVGREQAPMVHPDFQFAGGSRRPLVGGVEGK